ncbi:MAG: DUF6544 family protein [Gemmatimonadota bacterium]
MTQHRSARWIGRTVAAAGAAAGAIALGTVYGRGRMQRTFEAESTTLEGIARTSPVTRVDRLRLQALPAPVQRYVEASGAAGSPGLRIAQVRQRGVLQADRQSRGIAFRSRQVYSMNPPAFTWLGSFSFAPGVRGWVRDRYIDGRGETLVKALSVIPLVNARGPEIDQGAALRFWGEVLAFPEIVTDPRLQWEAVGEREAVVHIFDRGEAYSARVGFSADGFYESFRTQRYRDERGAGVLTDWSGRMSAWTQFDGRWFPSRWTSVWHLEDGDLDAVTMDVEAVETR